MARTNGNLREMKSVFEIEVEALQAAMKCMSADFGRTVHLLAQCKGRI